MFERQPPKRPFDAPPRTRAATHRKTNHSMPTQHTLVETYRTHLLAAGRGSGTVDLRIRHLGYLARDHADLLAVTRKDLEQYLADRRDSHSAATRRSLRASFRTFYAWALAEELLSVDPSAHLPAIRGTQAPARVAVDTDVERGLEGATVEEQAIVLLARFACLRRSEIASLHTKNREGDLLRVTGKGQKVRMVALSTELLELLVRLEAVRGDGFYFPGRITGHRHPDSVYDTIKRLTSWHPHSLRHRGATAAYRATNDLLGLQAMLGHSSAATTERYVTLGDDSIRALAAANGFRSRTRSPGPSGAPFSVS